MSNSSTSDLPTPESLVFAAYHQRTLDPGEYVITVEHTFHTVDQTTIPPRKSPDGKKILPSFTATRRFRVEGERFQLKPDDIQAVFPPQGSLGDHSNVLPHIVLTHSTLPWEGSADGSSDPIPCLLLLVFREAENPETKVITLGELGTQGPRFPSLSLDPLQKASPVSVIDIHRNVLEPLLPSRDELKILAHVRRLQFSDETSAKMSRDNLDENECAVIIANRLPEAGATSTVHLVSVKGRYDVGTGRFNFQNAAPEDEIRLVSLTSWRLACISSDHTFANMVQGLEHDHQSFRLPKSSNSDAETFLQDGFVPVHHALRQGGKTISWYRGPFVTGTVNGKFTLPVHTSDALLRYHSNVGLFDVSYASAWELGRLMALQSPTFSSTLYEWKRLRDQQHKSSQRPEQSDHPLETLDIDTTMPESVKTWLDQLSYLQGVPFKYLVPDEQLLPKESIRFFQLDVNWIHCLLDGAYSIGRITKTDFECDHLTSLASPYVQATGILLRSDIVSGYPGLLIDAYDDQNNKLKELRRENLSPNILLCIFKGNLHRLDIQQKPEMLHFALELPDEQRYEKKLRNGQTISGDLPPTRVVPILDIKKSIGGDNSGHFALQMLETAEKVSFIKGS